MHYKASEFVGIALNATYNRNPIDHQRTEELLEEITGYKFTVSEEAFDVFFLLLGPSFDYAKEKVSFSFQPGIGLGTVAYITQTARSEELATLSKYSSGEGRGLAWGCTLSTAVFLSEQIGIAFDVRYQGSTMERSYSSSVSVGNGLPVVNLEVDDFQPMIFSAGVGLVIRI